MKKESQCAIISFLKKQADPDSGFKNRETWSLSMMRTILQAIETRRFLTLSSAYIWRH